MAPCLLRALTWPATSVSPCQRSLPLCPGPPVGQSSPQVDTRDTRYKRGTQSRPEQSNSWRRAREQHESEKTMFPPVVGLFPSKNHMEKMLQRDGSRKQGSRRGISLVGDHLTRTSSLPTPGNERHSREKGVCKHESFLPAVVPVTMYAASRFVVCPCP